jgi:hypothetical protein
MKIRGVWIRRDADCIKRRVVALKYIVCLACPIIMKIG